MLAIEKTNERKKELNQPILRNENLKLKDNAVLKKEERVPTIDNTRINRIVNAFFGKDVKYAMNSHELVQTGQMAPKEVVSIKNSKDKNYEDKYLLREFAFYITGGEEFVKFNIDYQNWISKNKLMTPPLKETCNDKGNKLYIVMHDTKGDKKFIYVQKFLESKNLSKTFLENSNLLGVTLERFHDSSNGYLNSNINSYPNFLEKNSEAIVKDLFNWGKDEFIKRHQDEKEQKAYLDLMEFCKRDIEKYQIDESKYAISKTVVHGDYNPGNIIVTEKSKDVYVIDFDDLRVDHPAADVSHALCQMMVFRFFDKTLKDRQIFSELSEESKKFGKDFINGYFKDSKDSAFINEMFERMEKEIPLAIHRGTLLGFLDFKIKPEHFENVKSNISKLNENFIEWLRNIKKEL